VIIQAGFTILRKEFFPLFKVQKAIKTKANRHVTPDISLDARLNALLVKKTSSCDSRPFGLAAEEKQQKGALSVAI
jgi:hypothetical protein